MRVEKILYGPIRAGFRVQRFGSRWSNRLNNFLGGLALAALPRAELVRLTGAIYGDRGQYEQQGIFEWERAWYAADLPPVPARILLGGAGSGRETRYLADLGYRVVAFDPAEAYVRGVGAEGSSRAEAFLAGSYEELAGLVDSPRGRALGREVAARGPYDAVVLGWGSFTHVVDSGARDALLRTCRRLCPDGPLLLSLWLRSEHTNLHGSRFWKAGWALGCVARGRSPAQAAPEGDVVYGHAGLGHWFTVAEFEALARQTGYEIVRSPVAPSTGTFPHATLRPASR